MIEPEDWVKAVKNCEDVSQYNSYTLNKEELYAIYPKFLRFYKKDHGFDYIKEKDRQTGVDYHDLFILRKDGKMFTPIRNHCELVHVKQGENSVKFVIAQMPSYHNILEGTESVNVENLDEQSVTTEPKGQLLTISQSYGMPENLVDNINEQFLVSSIESENKTIFDLFRKPTTKWLDGDGKDITNDRTFKKLSMQSILMAKRHIYESGINMDKILLYTSNSGLHDLIRDPDLYIYIMKNKPEIIDQGVIEKIMGIKILVDDNLTRTEEVKVLKRESWWQKIKRIWFRKERPYETLPQGYRSILFVDGISFGLVSSDKIVMEMQRRNELQSIYVAGTNRLAACIKNKDSVVCISHS